MKKGIAVLAIVVMFVGCGASDASSGLSREESSSIVDNPSNSTSSNKAEFLSGVEGYIIPEYENYIGLNDENNGTLIAFEGSVTECILLDNFYGYIISTRDGDWFVKAGNENPASFRDGDWFVNTGDENTASFRDLVRKVPIGSNVYVYASYDNTILSPIPSCSIEITDETANFNQIVITGEMQEVITWNTFAHKASAVDMIINVWLRAHYDHTSRGEATNTSERTYAEQIGAVLLMLPEAYELENRNAMLSLVGFYTSARDSTFEKVGITREEAVTDIITAFNDLLDSFNTLFEQYEQEFEALSNISDGDERIAQLDVLYSIFLQIAAL